MGHVIGVDIGGTFTDCVVVGDDGAATIGKSASTPPDFADGFVNAMGAAAQQRGVGLAALAREARGIYHGCTVGTNALVEGRTGRVGLLVTAGHRESAFIMEAGGRLHNLPPHELAHVAAHGKPDPLVPRELVVEIHERVAADGAVVAELNEAQARRQISDLVELGIDAFAVSFLWAVNNDAHENAMRALIEELLPGAFVSLSHEVAPRVGEYQRTVATVMNSMIGPTMKSYLSELGDKLRHLGYRGEVHLMTCSGGLIDSASAQELPVLTIDSGPVAGIIGSRLLSERRRERPPVITTDIGGTTLDVGVIMDGRPRTRATSWHGQFEYFVPTVDVRSIGSGGGSIIHWDATADSLRVGPRSAGARPGPAAYARGGRDATVTDADLIVGYLNAANFLGGSVPLSLDAARDALARAGEPLGFGPDRTAAAACRILDSQMADAIRLVTIDQGLDPRRFVLYAYGGGGPVHATAIAAQLGMSRVVVPINDFAAGWSAFGVAAADALIIEELPCALRHPLDPDALNEIWRRLESSAMERAAAHQAIAGERIVERIAEFRHTLQVGRVSVEAPGGSYDERTAGRLVETFQQEYERLFHSGRGYEPAGITMTSAAVRIRAKISDFELAESVIPHADAAPPKAGERMVLWYELGPERVPTPVYDGGRFAWGMAVEGPAIIEYPDTTLVIRSNQRATMDPLGSVVIDIGHRAARVAPQRRVDKN